MDIYWYSNDLIHWLEVDEKGNHFYFMNGKLHREDGPACEYKVTGFKLWYINGKCIGSNHEADYRNGRCRTQEEFEMLMKLRAFW